MKNIKKWVSLLLVAVMVLTLIVQPAFADSEPEYLIQITDNISLENNIASQTGTLTFNSWNSAGTFSGTKQTANSTFEQLKYVQTAALDWQNPFTINAAQFSQTKKTVIDVKFKVTLDDYNTSTSPRIGIRLFQSGLIQREALAQKNGKNAYTPTEGTKNDWNIVRFVIDPETQTVYSSFNGSDYAGSEFHTSTDGATGNYSGDFRIYFTAIPAAEAFTDGSTALETPVTWYIDEFTAYETDGDIPAAPEKPANDAEIAANISYIVKLDDNMNHNTTNFSTTQEGTLNFIRINGTEICGYGSVGNNWDQIKVTQSVMSDWKNNFYIDGSEVSTSRMTVIDMKFKVNLDDYTKETLPKVGLRFYHNKGLFFIDGMTGKVPAEADKDAWQTVRFVINNEDKKVYASLNAGAYTSKDFSTEITADTFGENGGQIRIYPIALPGGETQVDGSTPLETPVNWYIDSFKAYQMDGEMPSPAEDPTTKAVSDVTALLRLTDYMQYNASTFTTMQSGYDLAMNFIEIDNTELAGEEADGVYYKQLKLTQNVMSSWKNTFWFDGTQMPSDKKTVIDIKFKVNLGDYTVENKPKVGWRLYNSNNSFYLDGMTNVVPAEADKDKWQTMRFVLNNEDGTAYGSLNGNAYTSNKFSADITDSTYGGQVRLYPVALPGGEAQVDGSTVLETPVTWYIDSVIVYQTGQVMPSASDLTDPTEPKTDDLPDAIPEPTEVPIPSELAGKVVRSYPEGKMKAVIMSFDDGSNWCEASDKKAIEILNERGAAATFNIVPGNCYGTFLANAAEMYKGHEIASHGYKHQHLDELDDAAFMEEIKLSKEMLEAAIGTEVPGFAYPYGWKSNSKRLRMMQNLGYRYTRAAVSTGKFDVPDTFYDWDPTSWLSVKTYWELTKSQMKTFKGMDASGEWQLMFTSGHAWQFEADADGNDGESYWYALEEFADYIKDNSDQMWNPTTAEFADYVRASRQMKASQSDDGSIVLTNSEKLDVWALVDGSAVKIPAGKTVTVGTVTEKEFLAKEYLLDVDTCITQSNSSVTAEGTLTYTGAISAAEDKESFYIKQDTKSAWSRYIMVTSPVMSGVKIDEPLVLEAKYNVKADSVEGTLPNVQLALQVQDLNIWANSGVGTALSAPTSEWNTVKFIIDPKTDKVYYSINGGAYSSAAADKLASVSQLGNGVRLYLRSYPSTSADDSGDATTALDTPVTWTFDYVRMYKLGADEAVKLSAASAAKSGDAVSCDIMVRNYDTQSTSCTLITALYDGCQLSDMYISELSPAAFAKQSINVQFNAAGVDAPTVKAFLWNSTSGLVPYDTELIEIK